MNWGGGLIALGLPSFFALLFWWSWIAGTIVLGALALEVWAWCYQWDGGRFHDRHREAVEGRYPIKGDFASTRSGGVPKC